MRFQRKRRGHPGHKVNSLALLVCLVPFAASADDASADDASADDARADDAGSNEAAAETAPQRSAPIRSEALRQAVEAVAQSRLTEAEGHLTVAGEAQPESPRPPYLQGSLKLVQETPEDAVSHFEQCLASADGHDTDLHLRCLIGLARAYERQPEKRADARTAWLRVQTLPEAVEGSVIATLAQARIDAIDAAQQAAELGAATKARVNAGE